MKTWHLILCLAPALCCCRDKAEQPAPEPASPVSETARDEPAPAQPADPPKLPDFEWTETPTLEAIPAAPMAGMIDGSPFVVGAAFVQPGLNRSWYIYLAQHAPPPERPGLLIGQPVAAITLAEQPEAGRTYQADMGKRENDVVRITRSTRPIVNDDVHEECAHAVEFLSWEARPWKPDGGSIQSAGSARLRLALTCKPATEGGEPGWLAGEVVAEVRYLGVPWWVNPEDIDQ